jgi:hypothetical protein
MTFLNKLRNVPFLALTALTLFMAAFVFASCHRALASFKVGIL